MYQKMDPEFKVRWLEALRSGDYKKGRFDLRSKEDEFCCFGVACDLEERDGKLIRISSPFDFKGYVYVEGENWYGAHLPGLMMERIGISDEVHTFLTVMNDWHAGNFDEIADWIEVNL